MTFGLHNSKYYIEIFLKYERIIHYDWSLILLRSPKSQSSFKFS